MTHVGVSRNQLYEKVNGQKKIESPIVVSITLCELLPVIRLDFNVAIVCE